MEHPQSYQQLLDLAEQCSRPVTHLFALALQNDPFRADHPSRRRDGEWFAQVWTAMDCGPGTHLRRLHYRLVSQLQPIELLDGSPYENTERCWKLLGQCSTAARYLGLVAAEHLVDRRNPPAELFLEFGSSHDIGVVGASELNIPLTQKPGILLTPPTIEQAYHTEIWCEKSTINDILMPLGEAYGVNIVTALGELSATACHALVKRAKELDRPARVLYISDFDPAGRSMPVAAARKIEHFVQRQADDDLLHITLQPIALTPEQCAEFKLPRTPIKDTERRGARFESRFGSGATELDALEALHPGALQEIITRELLRFYDPTLAGRTERAAKALKSELDRLTAEILAQEPETWKSIAQEWRAIEPRIEAFNYQIRAAHRAVAEIEDAVSELEIEWPEPEDGDDYGPDDEPLFNSSRGYLEQLDHYRAFQGKAPQNGNGEDHQ